MDEGGSDVMTWDEVNARENGTDGFFGPEFECSYCNEVTSNPDLLCEACDNENHDYEDTGCGQEYELDR
jgi:hypothetical protein